MNNWREIWERRKDDDAAASLLTELLSADGYDTLGAVEPAAWVAYTGRIAATLKLSPGDSIFDVGCGSGAFLWPLRERGHRVGGIDYSVNQIARARRAMPEAVDLMAGEARALELSPKYDSVVACATFLYFQDLDYAADVVKRMVAKARKSVAILDAPDLSLRDEILRERKAALGEAAYNERYAGLDHLYFSKKWFEQVFADLGLACTIQDQNLEGYRHNPHRFNIFAFKTEAMDAPST